jgi:excisionase family DNA binding protein
MKLGYSVPEACDAVPCGKTKLYELIANGKLDARKVGATVIITAESLKAFHAALPAAEVRCPSLVQGKAA